MFACLKELTMAKNDASETIEIENIQDTEMSFQQQMSVCQQKRFSLFSVFYCCC